jgi:flagella basal body P-ring formation protein FlgA
MGMFLTFLIVESGAATSTLIRVAQMTRINGEHILLGKIAHIEGNDPQLVQQLRSIMIGRSPLPGKTRSIDASDVKRRLKQNRIDLKQLVLDIPPRLTVERNFTEIEVEQIKSLVADYISQNMINNLRDANIKEIQVTENLKLPSGRITYTVKPSNRSDRMGKIPFTVNFEVNGKFYKRVWAAATLEIFADVVVTQKPLGRHKPITEDDIEIRKMDLAQLPSDVITDPTAILGQRTRRAIGSKTVLRPNLVEFPPLLKRGDVVVIIAETAGLKITALGQVKKKGRLGERIPVINFDSKKVLYARVLDGNTVKVELK